MCVCLFLCVCVFVLCVGGIDFEVQAHTTRLLYMI